MDRVSDYEHTLCTVIIDGTDSMHNEAKCGWIQNETGHQSQRRRAQGGTVTGYSECKSMDNIFRSDTIDTAKLQCRSAWRRSYVEVNSNLCSMRTGYQQMPFAIDLSIRYVTWYTCTLSSVYVNVFCRKMYMQNYVQTGCESEHPRIEPVHLIQICTEFHGIYGDQRE